MGTGCAAYGMVSPKDGDTMIEASFAPRTYRMSAVSGAYQYDVGQRLRMHGLPSKSDLEEMDDLLTEESVVSVEVQYSYIDEAKTESRMAIWDNEEEVWVADIPDHYLSIAEPVHLYITVSYGSIQDGGSRIKTLYDGAFTPIARPAPDDAVTEETKNEWAALKSEVRAAIDNADAKAASASNAAAEAGRLIERIDTIVIPAMDSAKEATEAATQNALNAIEAANTATENAITMTEQLGEMTASAESVVASAEAEAILTTVDDHKDIHFKIPRGRDMVFNLLQNSDFANPYQSIDRNWTRTTSIGSVSVGVGGATFTNGMNGGTAKWRQTSEYAYLDDWRYTLAICDGAGAITIAPVSGPVSIPYDSGNAAISLSMAGGRVTAEIEVHGDFQTFVTIRWIALYEGSYTIDNLPRCQSNDGHQRTAVGTVVQSHVDSVTTSATTNKQAAMLSLTAGTWVLTVSIRNAHPNSGSGNINMRVFDSANLFVDDHFVCGTSAYNPSTAERALSATAVLELDAGATFYTILYTSNAYTASNITMKAVRIV